MALPKTKENWSRPSSTPAQTASQIVVAIAAVASFLAQSKDHPRLAWGLVVLAVFVLFANYGKRLYGRLQTARVRLIRNNRARTRYSEFQEHAKRFSQFVNMMDA